MKNLSSRYVKSEREPLRIYHHRPYEECVFGLAENAETEYQFSMKSTTYWPYGLCLNPKADQPEKWQCWNIYSLITDIYSPKPERIRDWVSVPKPNGYEALHLTVMGPEGQWFEVQIRSERMDEIAEKGLAAHWEI